ncbi:hypothetical protein Y032_0018g3557 [Ancylostoma ceylanicum]|uniref:Eukaryotic translation initiation factor 3 subunit K n=1 Tax=Ancylostoma ceylanicum TaxID=53326 RepID=A0A016V520_9BILA|nr:hypothetical protein Y032_0018g3557 [Ancylostoma ceylanicum]
MICSLFLTRKGVLNGRLCQLISSGVLVDSLDSKQSRNTLLNWASDFSTVDIVRTLCDSGASVDQPNAKGETPLFTAVRRGDEAIVRQLLASGADPTKKTDKGEDAFSIATAKGGALLPLLSMDKLARAVRRTTSVESVDYDRASITSEALTTHLFTDRTEKYMDGKPESWTDLLWPQPKLVKINSSSKGFPLPKDNRLKIYFCDASSGCPRRMMQAIQISAPLLSSVNLDMEYRGHKTADHDSSPLDGKVTCGIYDDGRPSGAYALNIDPRGVEIVASDYCGIRYGFATLVQIIRLQKFASRHAAGDASPNASYTSSTSNGWSNSNDSGINGVLPEGSPASALRESADLPGMSTDGMIPSLTVRDHPDRPFRAIFQDFSGCRILNTETLLQLATRLSYCKANYLFVNFEVRTTDRYQLPYTNRDLFHMMQVCEELFVTLVPSFDTQSNYIEPGAARDIIEYFLNDFPLSKTAHFGPNLTSILIANRNVLAAIQRRVPKIFLSSHVDEKNATLLSSVPPYVTLCVEGSFPFEAEKWLSPRVSIVLKFSTGDDGYLCAAPDSTAKKAMLAARLGEKCNVLGTMVCDLSTGCEAMPPSLSYMSLLSAIGVAWNGSCDMKKFAFLQPAIAAHHILMDGDMTALFEQAATLGRVEHELTRFSCGIWRPAMANSTISEEGEAQISGFGISKKMPISVFVEMILNPENLNLERLTPVIFKKARIELRRSLMALDAARKTLPYNFELALVLAEIKLVTELMVLTSRLGQALCMHGARAGKIREEGVPYSPGRVGVGHLPLTVRTDLANSLLEIRTQFQHVWLSRSIPSTLPNALKMFDNLFRALLPPDLQERIPWILDCDNYVINFVVFIQMSFEQMREHLHAAIQGVNRYNPENVGDLAKCVQLMASENQYDRDIVLTILKLYQLNPDKYDEGIVRLVLLKTLMVLPNSDFALAKFLIDSNRLGSQELKRVLDLGSVLEACDFAVFWALMKGEYKPSTDVSERFKIPQEVPRMVKAVAGFEEAVRVYACRVISVTFQNIEKTVLSRLLGGASDKQVADYAKRFGWEEKPNGVYFIANHEATIRTRNIDEKLQFSNVADILRNMPGIPVLEQ